MWLRFPDFKSIYYSFPDVKRIYYSFLHVHAIVPLPELLYLQLFCHTSIQVRSYNFPLLFAYCHRDYLEKRLVILYICKLIPLHVFVEFLIIVSKKYRISSYIKFDPVPNRSRVLKILGFFKPNRQFMTFIMFL